MSRFSPAHIRRAVDVTTLLIRAKMLPLPKTVPKIVDFALQQPAIKCLQHRTELLEFSQIVAAVKPKAVLEIGTYMGGTMFVFARLSAPGAIVISLDQWPFTRLHPMMLGSFCRGREFRAVYGDSKSQDTLARVRAITPMLDFLFIDGDHCYEGVHSDFEMYSPLVQKGGIIAFHDIITTLPDCQVPRLWNEIKGNYPYREIVEDSTREWGGIGVLYV